MRIDGIWFPCDYAVVRPVILGGALTASGSWKSIPFLIDTGADRTVLNAAALAGLEFPTALAQGQRLGGLGGLIDSVLVDTKIGLPNDAGGRTIFKGPFPAVTEPEALDLSVIGRDVLGHFAVIVDHAHAVACLLSQRHRYRIEWE